MSFYYDTRYTDEQAETVVELWGEIETELIKEIAKFVKRALEYGEDLSYTGELRAQYHPKSSSHTRCQSIRISP